MKRGFTLIEILVVVGIMAVLTAVGVASYNTIGDRAKAQQTAQLIATHLRSAQKDADAGVGTFKNGLPQCTKTDPFYGIQVSYAPSTITMTTLCGVNYSSVTSYPLRTVDLKLPSGVTVNWSGPVVFRSLSKTMSETIPTITASTYGTNIYTLNITTSGGINVSP